MMNNSFRGGDKTENSCSAKPVDNYPPSFDAENEFCADFTLIEEDVISKVKVNISIKD